MEPIDYKALYEDAHERAKQIKYGNPSSGTAIVVCEQIFPDLKESEDERIRKNLISFLEALYAKGKSAYDGEQWSKSDCADWIAYLEKQKETLHISESCKENSDSFTGWSEEDKKNLELVIDCIYEFYPDPVMKYKLKDWLKSLRPQPKPSWSEEDQLNLNWVIAILNGEPCELDIQLESLISWLKSLRPDSYKNCNSRLKPSEEEKDNISILLCMIDSMDSISLPSGTLRISGEKRRELKEFIKRPSWKPSDEQMAVLLNAEGLMRANNYKENAKILAELYGELKKLM